MGVEGRGLCIQDSVVFDAPIFPAVLSYVSVVAATASSSLSLPPLSMAAAARAGELLAKSTLLEDEER